MTNCIDRTSARSTKGWISGDHLAASDHNRFLDDSEADFSFRVRKTTNIDTTDSLKRPTK